MLSSIFFKKKKDKFVKYISYITKKYTCESLRKIGNARNRKNTTWRRGPQVFHPNSTLVFFFLLLPPLLLFLFETEHSRVSRSNASGQWLVLWNTRPPCHHDWKPFRRIRSDSCLARQGAHLSVLSSSVVSFFFFFFSFFSFFFSFFPSLNTVLSPTKTCSNLVHTLKHPRGGIIGSPCCCPLTLPKVF